MNFVFDSQWLTIVILSGVFSFLALTYYYRKDKIEPEPLSRVAFAFFLGILSTGLAYILSFVSIELLKRSVSDEITLGLISAVGIAPVVEEFCKLLMVIYLSRFKTFDGPLDGLIYGAAVGAGFSFSENILYGIRYTLNSGLSTGISVTIVRGVIQIIGHPLYTGLAGAGVGMHKVRLSDTPYSKYWRSVFFHMIWNLSSLFSGFILLIMGGIYGFNQLQKELRFAQELDLIAYSTGYYARKESNLM